MSRALNLFPFFSFLCIIAIEAEMTEGPLTVVCPHFEEEGELDSGSTIKKPSLRRIVTYSDYCECKFNSVKSGRTAIIICDFKFEKNIILKENLFEFKKWNTTSAYVRMTNCLSANVTSDFLSSWMDSPSSAMDLWHCGNVELESTPELNPPQIFSKLKTFIGVGLVDCNITSIPQFFLRDRSRAAIRFKDCRVDAMKAGMFHNIGEVRYMVIENSYIKEVEGPVSSSGTVQLSRKSMHAWDGFELLNSTISKIADYGFNFTHKSDTEDFIIRKSALGEVGVGGISARGDMKVVVAENSFAYLGPKAIQIEVSAQVLFSGNTINKFSDSSLMGIKCLSGHLTLSNNTFHATKNQSSFATVAALIRKECSVGKVNNLVQSYFTKDNSQVVRSTAIAISVVIVLAILAVGALWMWRKGLLRSYKYRRQDTPLCKEEMNEASEEPSNTFKL